MSSYAESLEEYFKYKDQLIMNKKLESKSFYTETDKEYRLELNKTQINIKKKNYLVLKDEIERLKKEANNLTLDVLSKQRMFLSSHKSSSVSNSIKTDMNEIENITKRIETLSNINSNFIEVTSSGELYSPDDSNNDEEKSDNTDDLESLNNDTSDEDQDSMNDDVESLNDDTSSTTSVENQESVNDDDVIPSVSYIDNEDNTKSVLIDFKNNNVESNETLASSYIEENDYESDGYDNNIIATENNDTASDKNIEINDDAVNIPSEINSSDKNIEDKNNNEVENENNIKTITVNV
jgi:hypothetical protein